MPSPPNSFFPWEGAYDLSCKVIDYQHREIAGIIGELYDSVQIHEPKHALVKRLTDLINSGRTHCATEEQILRTNNYPEYLSHRAFHEALVQALILLRQKVAAGEQELNAGWVELMKLWMVEHIQEQDRSWRKFLEQRGPGSCDGSNHHHGR